MSQMSTANLEEILLKFLQHVNELEIKDERTSMTGFEQEFRELRLQGIKDKEEDTYPAEEGKQIFNIKKNRYKDIIPYDATRVKLKSVPNVPGSDYINANYIQSAVSGHGYIACQGPLPNTVADFWRMIMELDVETVVMGCKEEEGNKPKCERYWPKDSEGKLFGNIEVKLINEIKHSSDFIVRQMTATQGDTVQHITQLHLAEWPDHGVPDVEDQTSILQTIQMLGERVRPHVPVVVHCSAGCGRTGTICAIDFAQNLLKSNKITPDFSLCEIIKFMRTQRQSMVQTPDQYQLAHYVVRQIFKNHLKGMGISHYENINVYETISMSKSSDLDDPGYENISVENSISTFPVYESKPRQETPLPPERKKKPETLTVTPEQCTSNSLSPVEMSPQNLSPAQRTPSPALYSNSLTCRPVTPIEQEWKVTSSGIYSNVNNTSEDTKKFVTCISAGNQEEDENLSSQDTISNLDRHVIPTKAPPVSPRYDHLQFNGNNSRSPYQELTPCPKGAAALMNSEMPSSKAKSLTMSGHGKADNTKNNDDHVYSVVSKSHMRSLSESDKTYCEISAMKSPASVDFGETETGFTPNLPPRKYKSDMEPFEKTKEEKHTGKLGKMLEMLHIKNSSNSEKHKHQKISIIGFGHRVGHPKGPRDLPHTFKK
nr:tyrosine-protein phosphatase non-receptor type 12 [Octopus vulgaris]